MVVMYLRCINPDVILYRMLFRR